MQYGFPATKPLDKNAVLPDETEKTSMRSASPETVSHQQQFPSVNSDEYWKHLIRHWAHCFGVLSLIDNVVKNPQPVEVIDYLANVTGTNRLRGVLASVLPVRPDISRAGGHYLLVLEVGKQIKAWVKSKFDLKNVLRQLSIFF